MPTYATCSATEVAKLAEQPLHSGRWRVLILYGIWNGLMQFEWLRFAPITDTVAAQYQMRVSEVGQLSLVFPLLFLPLALPMGWLIDRRSARFSLWLTAILMTLGVALRVAMSNPIALFAGQIVIATVQPLVMALIPKLVGVWFIESQRLLATSLGTLSIFVGLGLAFLLIPPTASWSLHASLWIDVAVFVVLLLATVVGVPRDPTHLDDTAENHPSWLQGMSSLLRNRGFAALLLLSFFANGYSNALFTWLQPMLQPQGIDSAHAGITGLMLLVGGIVGMILLSRIPNIDQRLRSLMLTVTLVGVPLTFLLLRTQGFAWIMAAGFLIGTLLLSPLPLLVDVISRLSGARLAGTAVSSFWLIGNAGAATAIWLMSQLIDLQRWSLATYSLAGLLLVNFMIAAFLLPPKR